MKAIEKKEAIEKLGFEVKEKYVNDRLIVLKRNPNDTINCIYVKSFKNINNAYKSIVK